jgi:carbon-monoxide dehydrogenase large subunit
MVTRHYAQRDYPFIFTNGVQASYVEVDVDTGFVKLLRHWVVEDCGRVLNPMLVDEQIRGAVVQGIGGALYEECLYDDDGLMRNGSMADYLVPMALRCRTSRWPTSRRPRAPRSWAPRAPAKPAPPARRRR